MYAAKNSSVLFYIQTLTVGLYYNGPSYALPQRQQDGTSKYMVQTNKHDPIDVVITWVDGSDKSHSAKRRRYMTQHQTVLHENAINPHRWVCSDEILYCLRSIENNAPWIRTIWIVVDDVTPDLSSLSLKLRSKISFTYHREIFQSFEDVLPTFNSLAIETLLWRIEGLAERFIYFNDDVFLISPLTPTDMFDDKKPVLRGHWVDYSGLQNDIKMQNDPAKFNHYMQINAAQIIGFSAHHLFAAAHVAHPFLRSEMAGLFDQYPKHFSANIAHRFRELSQFLPQGLHNHACIAGGRATFKNQSDYLHIYSGQGNENSSGEVSTMLQAITDTNNIKMLCINDLPQLEILVPDIRHQLTQAISGLKSTQPPRKPV